MVYLSVACVLFNVCEQQCKDDVRLCPLRGYLRVVQRVLVCNIGKPFPIVETMLVDDNGDEVEKGRGNRGELLVRSSLVCTTASLCACDA